MYGNFPNPYGAGSYPAMQNRLANLEQQYQQYQRPQMSLPLSGRMVTGMEEARASQIPLDGTISYFPSPAENKIYAKSVDMNGLPVFLTYELKMPESCNQNSKSEHNVQISELNCRIIAIENKIKEMEQNGKPATDNANVSAQ